VLLRSLQVNNFMYGALITQTKPNDLTIFQSELLKLCKQKPYLKCHVKFSFYAA